MKDDYEKSHWPTQKWFVAPVIHRKTVQGSWHVIGKGFLDKAKLQRPYGIAWHFFGHTCTAMRIQTVYAQYGHTFSDEYGHYQGCARWRRRSRSGGYRAHEAPDLDAVWVEPANDSPNRGRPVSARSTGGLWPSKSPRRYRARSGPASPDKD